jgi:hypothetical protein
MAREMHISGQGCFFMNSRFLVAIVSAAALAIPAVAQNQRRAVIVAGGNGVEGRCTGEVVVDGAADLQIQGDTASVRDLSGSQPQLRRFECTGPLPAQANVRLNVNGRGSAQLVSSPNNGGPAVVRFQDREGGASSYQFDLTWDSGLAQGYANQGYPNQGYPNQRYPNQGYNNQGYPPASDRRYSDRPMVNGFGSQQAVNVCREAIREQAMDRFGTRDVDFGRINIDDNPGRRDWVVGTVGVRRGYGERQFPFSCSVNFDNGRVRTAQIDAPHTGYAGRDAVAREMDTCRSAVSDRIGGRVNFGSMNVDGDGDMVRGRAWSRGRSFDFSCRVSPYSGEVRSVDVQRR